MKTVCHKNGYFSNSGKKEILFGFDGGNITSDGGSILVAKAMKRMKTVESIVSCLNDGRDQLKVHHTLNDLIEQRIMLLTLGYEDCNDSNHLRNDPMIKSALGRLPETGKELGSQSTLSRLENSVNLRNIARMQHTLLENYIERVKNSGIQQVILDIDTTDDETHGEQEGSLFNGYYQETMYSQLLIFDGESGDIITAKLRPGNIHTSINATVSIHRVVQGLKQSIPGIEIIVRGDSGFGVPEMLEYCERNNIKYILGLKGNRRLEKRSAKLRKRAKSRYQNTGRTVVFYGNYEYKAKAWLQSRKGFVKVEYGALGLNTRYVVTNMDMKSPKAGYIFYGKRGQMENYIKEAKNGMFSDRLSCHRFIANYFRLMLTAFAYGVMLEIRTQLKGSDLENAEAQTIRLRFFKVGGLIEETVRKVWIRLSSSFVYKKLFQQVYSGLSG